MPTRTLRTKRLSVSVNIPQRLATFAKRLRSTAQGMARSPDLPGGGSGSFLSIPKRVPYVGYQSRDPERSSEYFRSIRARTRDDDTKFRNGERDEGNAEWTEAELTEAVSSVWWYHTIELPYGIVTPGVYDHRPLLAHYGVPSDLAGERILDVATFDGFWAFEFERRGAEVVATDISRIRDLDLPPKLRDVLVRDGVDWKTGLGFEVAHQALRSTVRRREINVYDFDPVEMGTFDLVHVSDLLLHLRDPIAALAAVARVTEGRAIITDCYDPSVEAGMSRYLGGWSVATWWALSLETLTQMVVDAGFSKVEVIRTFRLGNAEAPKGLWRASLLATK